MKFHKAKCKVLPWLGRKNPLPRHRLRAARLQCSSARKAWGSGPAASWADPTACPGNRDRQQCPQLCKYTGGRSREGIIPQHSSGVLHPVWGSPVEQRHWQTGVSSAESHQDDQGWKTCPVRRGWGTRACSACRRQLWGEPNSYLPVLTGMETEKGSAVHGRVRDSRQKSKQQRLGLDIRRKFPHKDKQAVVWVAQRSCAGSILGSLQHQLDKALSRLVWPYSWHCLSRRLDWRPATVASNLNYPVSLWYYIVITMKNDQQCFSSFFYSSNTWDSLALL